MRVFVTGASGFVGLHCTRALLEAGHEVTLGVRSAAKMRDLLSRYNLPELPMVVGDITAADKLREAMAGCDGVIHAAAMVSLDPRDEVAMYRTNVEGTQAVMAAAADCGVTALVHVSSAAALFDPALQRIDESTPLAPGRTAYARSKVAADQHVRDLITAGAPIAITYPCSVVGPDDVTISEANRSIQILLRYCHIHTSSGLQMIDVRDLARAQVKLLEQRMTGTYLAAGHYIEYRELGELLEKVTGRRLVKLPAPGPLLRGVGRATDLLGRVLPVNSPLTAEAADFATRWVPCHDDKLRGALDLSYRPLADTLTDTVRWLSAEGHIQAKWATNLRGVAGQ